MGDAWWPWPLSRPGHVGSSGPCPWGLGRPSTSYGAHMRIILLLLLVALIFAGVGFALHVLWVIAVIYFVAWLVGLAFGKGSRRTNR
jgi:hypothetical protein